MFFLLKVQKSQTQIIGTSAFEVFKNYFENNHLYQFHNVQIWINISNHFFSVVV